MPDRASRSSASPIYPLRSQSGAPVPLRRREARTRGNLLQYIHEPHAPRDDFISRSQWVVIVWLRSFFAVFYRLFNQPARALCRHGGAGDEGQLAQGHRRAVGLVGLGADVHAALLRHPAAKRRGVLDTHHCSRAAVLGAPDGDLLEGSGEGKSVPVAGVVGALEVLNYKVADPVPSSVGQDVPLLPHGAQGGDCVSSVDGCALELDGQGLAKDVVLDIAAALHRVVCDGTLAGHGLTVDHDLSGFRCQRIGFCSV